jgi:hypothetical protein
MPNVKVQVSNEIQIPNEMPKQVRHDQNVILNSFQNPIYLFAIDLTFACLREAAPAKAGILTFELFPNNYPPATGGKTLRTSPSFNICSFFP